MLPHSPSLRLAPGPGLIEAMTRHGQTWPEVVEDLEQPQVIAPVFGYPERRRLLGMRFYGYGVPEIIEQQEAFVLLGLRYRIGMHGEANNIVGIETAGPKSNKSGGCGQRWPTSLKNLIVELERYDGVVVEPGSKHTHVKRYGQIIETLPIHSGDWRAIRNICLSLKRKGIDLSKTA